MKYFFSILAILVSSFAVAQNYSLVYGDPKFMQPNPAYGEQNPKQDKFILKPGLPDGSYTIFYNSEMTNVFQKGFLQEGHRIKSWAYYNENGKPKMEMEYDESGLLSGLVKEYYPSGALLTESQFRNGQANGMLISYYESGLKKMQCLMKENNMVGKATFYDESGKVKQTMDVRYQEDQKKEIDPLAK